MPQPSHTISVLPGSATSGPSPNRIEGKRRPAAKPGPTHVLCAIAAARIATTSGLHHKLSTAPGRNRRRRHPPSHVSRFYLGELPIGALWQL
eukprot:gene9020-biopygen10703